MTRKKTQPYLGAYVGGRFRREKNPGRIRSKRDPGDLDHVIGDWYETPGRIDAAIESARRAFRFWRDEKPSVRARFLKALQRSYRRHAKDLSIVISREMGKPLQESRGEVQAAIARIDSTLREGLALVSSTRGKNSREYINYPPRGVLLILAPFNFPLHLPNGNFIAALATGNTVVFKPSELTPFTGQLIAQCFAEAGFPRGVFNMVQGKAGVGKRLVAHPDVNGVLFVGSDGVGQKIQEQVHRDPGKICVLEMGGKNGAIICEDASLSRAVADCAKSAWSTTGQRCTSLSRLFLHRRIADRFLTKFLPVSRGWQIGHFQIPSAQMGPLVSSAAETSFRAYLDEASRTGAKVLLRSEKLRRPQRGYYVSPSIHLIKAKRPRKEQKGYRYDELFGPDVAVFLFDDLAEAIDLHNDSRYGLVASVYSKKRSSFEKCLSTLQVGNLFWNHPTVGSSAHLPFGGIKASGNHFPAGLFSPYYCTYPLAVRE